uniref:Uncharacterized protein n=1 Tax=Triticum urartu TaxID=4572 RepID=A0A8R7UDD5_TRIUA
FCPPRGLWIDSARPRRGCIRVTAHSGLPYQCHRCQPANRSQTQHLSSQERQLRLCCSPTRPEEPDLGAHGCRRTPLTVGT